VALGWKGEAPEREQRESRRPRREGVMFRVEEGLREWME